VVASDDTAIVDVRSIIAALAEHAERVRDVPHGAPPAFLLDADRMGEGRAVVPGLFDNRSVCAASDFPSEDTLWQAGIRRAVVICNAIASDLEPVLFDWQRRGITLWRARGDDDAPAAPWMLARRGWIPRVVSSLRRSMLRPRADGAYGTLVLTPSAG
jgi:hypothetical protein